MNRTAQGVKLKQTYENIFHPGDEVVIVNIDGSKEYGIVKKLGKSRVKVNVSGSVKCIKPNRLKVIRDASFSPTTSSVQPILSEDKMKKVREINKLTGQKAVDKVKRLKDRDILYHLFYYGRLKCVREAAAERGLKLDEQAIIG